MMHGDLAVFALGASVEFGAAVAREMGIALEGLEERAFEDGEHKTRPRVSVRDRDVYVLQSLHSDPAQSVNDKLVRLLLFLGALRDASAARVTAVVPYLAYARKDRKSKSRDPVSTRYVAQLFEAVGADCVVTLDVHNLAAFQNAFRCRSENLEANPLFVS
ncbi:MAG TPA: ribose-phosphate pyrophosphokinase-like domain-containing protein, partial [Casimicrobiaceae bacterium]|nr:ribose-phosphate pyrophosphokinase-like domain-containing protein [Casimicrobiaceae bacterium]